MKNRRKMYHDIYPQYSPAYMPKTTVVVCALVLIIGALFFGYRYYVMRQQAQDPIKKPVERQQEGDIPTQESSHPTIE